jgi:hypothetical protein
VFPGDCVVFSGVGEGFEDPLVWYPQRVSHVAPGPQGWQRVWAMCSLDAEKHFAEDPMYWCNCTATWRVEPDGTLTLRPSMPLM